MYLHQIWICIRGICDHPDAAYLGNHRLLRPLRPEILDQLLEVVSGGLPDGEHVVDEPRHAEAVQLLVEEVDPELAGEQRHVLDDGQPHPPPPLAALRTIGVSSWQRFRKRTRSSALTGWETLE